MIIYRPSIATSHGPAKYLWSPKKCVFCSLPILITELAPPTHAHESPSPFPLGCGDGARNRPSFPRVFQDYHHPNATLTPVFAPTPQVSPATQAVCHHTGTCRAPLPSRPTITPSPRAWTDTALPPCPIWAVPPPSSTAQLPTRPMPVSRDVCPAFLHVSLEELGIVPCGPVGRVSQSEGPCLSILQGTISSRNLRSPVLTFLPTKSP